MNKMKTKKGFTLVEIQVAALVTFIVFMAALSLYIAYYKIFVTGNTILDVYANSRIAVALIAKDIRWAAQVEANSGSYTTTDSSIVLKVPSIDNTGKIISAKYDEVVYKLQGKDLYRIVIPSAVSSRASSNRAVAYNCASLTFSSGLKLLSQIGGANLSDVNTVAISLPINETIISLSGAKMVTESMTPTTVVKLRNK